jgi:hypothetical protein
VAHGRLQQVRQRSRRPLPPVSLRYSIVICILTQLRRCTPARAAWHGTGAAGSEPLHVFAAFVSTPGSSPSHSSSTHTSCKSIKQHAAPTPVPQRWFVTGDPGRKVGVEMWCFRLLCCSGNLRQWQDAWPDKVATQVAGRGRVRGPRGARLIPDAHTIAAHIRIPPPQPAAQ